MQLDYAEDIESRDEGKIGNRWDIMSYVNNYTTQREVKLKQIKMMVSRKLPAQILKEENKIREIHTLSYRYRRN